MLTMALRGYAWAICRLIWSVTWLARPWRDAEAVEPLEKNHAYRPHEWVSEHRCEWCGHKGEHKFIEWVEGAARPVTAECPECGHVEDIS